MYTRHDSPVGPLLLAGDGVGLKIIGFASGKSRVEPGAEWEERREAFADAVLQLDEYFAGTRREFQLRLAPDGTTFQMQVWQTLTRIPYGETWSYRDLATALGNVQAVRAVGLANGRNPLPIVIPCHRVIGADGSLTGYGGGLPIKTALLALERRVVSKGGQLDLLLDAHNS
jgi:methylated-DNA-[protein]-cysteine S-methyltransferase